MNERDDDYFGPVESDVEGGDASIVSAPQTAVDASDTSVNKPATPVRSAARKKEKKTNKSKRKTPHDRAPDKKSRRTRYETKDGTTHGRSLRDNDNDAMLPTSSEPTHDDKDGNSSNNNNNADPFSSPHTGQRSRSVSLASSSPSTVSSAHFEPASTVRPAQRKNTSRRKYASSRAYRVQDTSANAEHDVRDTDGGNDANDTSDEKSELATEAQDYEDDFDEAVEDDADLSQRYDDDFDESVEETRVGQTSAPEPPSSPSRAAPPPTDDDAWANSYPDVQPMTLTRQAAARAPLRTSPPPPHRALSGNHTASISAIDERVTSSTVEATLTRLVTAVNALHRDSDRRARTWQHTQQSLRQEMNALRHALAGARGAGVRGTTPPPSPPPPVASNPSHDAPPRIPPCEARGRARRGRMAWNRDQDDPHPTREVRGLFAQLATDVREVFHALNAAVVHAEQERVARDERHRRALAEAWRRTMQEELRLCRCDAAHGRATDVVPPAAMLSVAHAGPGGGGGTNRQPVPEPVPREECRRGGDEACRVCGSCETPPAWVAQLDTRWQSAWRDYAHTQSARLAPRTAELVIAAMTEEFGALRRVLAEAADAAQSQRAADVASLRQWHDRSDAARAAAAAQLADALSRRVEGVVAVCADVVTRWEAQSVHIAAAANRSAIHKCHADRLVGHDAASDCTDDARRAAEERLTAAVSRLQAALDTHPAVHEEGGGTAGAMLERLERCCARIEQSCDRPCATCASHLSRLCSTDPASVSVHAANQPPRRDGSRVMQGRWFGMPAPCWPTGHPTLPASAAMAHVPPSFPAAAESNARLWEQKEQHEWAEAGLSALASERRRLGQARDDLALAQQRVQRTSATLAERARALRRRQTHVAAAAARLRRRERAVTAAAAALRSESAALRRAKAQIVQRCVAVQERVRAAMRQRRCGHAARLLRRRCWAMRRGADAALSHALARSARRLCEDGGGAHTDAVDTGQAKDDGDGGKHNRSGHGRGGRCTRASYAAAASPMDVDIQRTAVPGKRRRDIAAKIRAGDDEEEEEENGGWSVLTRLHVDLANQRAMLARMASRDRDLSE